MQTFTLFAAIETAKYGIRLYITEVLVLEKLLVWFMIFLDLK